MVRWSVERPKTVAALLCTSLVLFGLSFTSPRSDSLASNLVPCPGVTSVEAGSPVATPSVVHTLNPCPGMEWAKSFGTATAGEYGYSVRQTPDGGYVVGMSAFGGSGVTVLLKLDAAGAIGWQKSYGPSYLVTPDSLEVLADGGYVFVSHNDHGDARLLRLDGNGTILWEKQYGGAGSDNLVSIATTTDGGFIVGGATDSWGAGQLDFWVMKLDAVGGVQWERVAGTSAYEFVRSIAQTSDGGYAVVGETDMDGWALKLDGQGTIVASQRMAGSKSYNGKFWTVVATPDGGFAAGASGSILAKFGASGFIQWKKSYGAEAIRSLAMTSDGGFVATGAKTVGSSNVEAMVLRIDASGNPLWMRTYGSAGSEQGWDVLQTADGGYVVAGQTTGFSLGYYDAWVLRLAGDGSVASTCPAGVGTTQTVSVSTARNQVSALTATSGATNAGLAPGSSAVSTYDARSTVQCAA